MVLNSKPSHYDAPPSLEAWLNSVNPAQEPSVREVNLDGVVCVVKRRRLGVVRGLSYGVRYFRALGLALGCKVFLGEFPNPSVLLRNGLVYEADRLQRLLDAGCRVPAIWARGPELLVLEHVGMDFADLIRHADEQQCEQWVKALAQDLADFHLQGHCHGGAQIRNVTLRDGLLWRIDFEENIAGALSLPLAQAYDLYQLISSFVGLRKLNVADPVGLGTLMLETYFATYPAADVKARLKRLARVICGSAKVLRPVGGRLPGRDIQGFFRVAEILQTLD
jgi:tRNA A-37 threonylcarbamoyl transferase component Bud32